MTIDHGRKCFSVSDLRYLMIACNLAVCSVREEKDFAAQYGMFSRDLTTNFERLSREVGDALTQVTGGSADGAEAAAILDT